MSQELLDSFCSPLERVEKALVALRAGSGILVTDDEERENEGELVYTAESLTVTTITIMIR